ncbi:hypothetical protein BHE74_00004440 [Ensete ventricosum]|nr:hypothetical protein BHE74_00004440 [Ensete ventricosum]
MMLRAVVQRARGNGLRLSTPLFLCCARFRSPLAPSSFPFLPPPAPNPDPNIESRYRLPFRSFLPLDLAEDVLMGSIGLGFRRRRRHPGRLCRPLEHRGSLSNIYKNNPLRKFSVLSARSSMTHHAQVAWQRLRVMYSYRGIASSPVSKIACATSLAVTRSHLVPSFLAFVAGEIALSKMAWADGEYFRTRDALYLRAQDSHIFLTSFILSLLECFILFLRAFYLAILFSPIIVMAPFADDCGPKFRKVWIHLVHSTLEKAGPALIKWGQWAATRPDLFPCDLCTELAKLHTKAPAHSFAYTRKSIEKAFGRKLSDVFENFEEEPVASGSIAQVHRASLRFRYPGQQAKRLVVAVKVRHPGVGESIRRDFMIINMVAKISKFVPTLKWLRLDESVQQFAVFMMSQVDLAREAAHLSRFIYNFRSWKDVSFPKPLYPLVHPAVLVETYEHGESVSYYVDELEGHDRVKSALAHIGTHALLKMLLV